MGCDIHATIERKDQKYGWWKNAGDPNLNRDYELFAVLAGVRNHCGIVPISEPRGLPKDASSIVESWSEQMDCDGHSHSWLTLAELKAFEPSQEVDDDRIVLERDESGQITSTCASTTLGVTERVGRRKVFGTWGRDHFDKLIAEMERAKRDGDTDQDVRLVFWFDN